jgi:hypothetical protein
MIWLDRYSLYKHPVILTGIAVELIKLCHNAKAKKGALKYIATSDKLKLVVTKNA